ncbi:unnamed protein product [Closterium sp. NIES-54]
MVTTTTFWAASDQVSASTPVAAPCSCHLLSHQTLLWHHRLGHPSLPRLRGMHSRLLVFGLPRSLPPLPPSPAPPCLPCVEGRQRAAPHSSSFPPTATPLQTLHIDSVSSSVSGSVRTFLSCVYTLIEVPRVSLPEKVGDASMFQVWGARPFVRDTSAVKLSSHAIPCVFLGFPSDTPGWQFYHPTSRRVLPSQNVTFDELAPFYCLFPYRTAPLPPPPPALFLTPGPPPVDPLPPQDPAPSGVSQVDPLPLAEPVKVTVDSGAARGAASGGAEPASAELGGAEPASAEPGGAEPEGAEPGGAEYEGAESGGAEPEGAEPGGAEPQGAEPWGAESEGAEFGGSEPREMVSAEGPAGAGAGGAGARDPGAGGPAAGGTGVGGAGATSPGGAGVPAGAGGPGGTGAADSGDADSGGARTRDLRTRRGMGAASHVLFSGSSVGGHAIIMHCDRLAAAFPRAQATCLSDSGFFVDLRRLKTDPPTPVIALLLPLPLAAACQMLRTALDRTSGGEGFRRSPLCTASMSRNAQQQVKAMHQGDPEVEMGLPGESQPANRFKSATRLVFLPSNAYTSKCLDGSPPAYYFRAGVGAGKRKWHVHLPTGGWCFSPGECLDRANSPLGSSRFWATRLPAVVENGGKVLNASEEYPQLGGLLSQDSVANPVFHAWNLVWVVYCDGGAYSSTRGRADMGGGASVYMQGRQILDDIITDLRTRQGMGAASHVLFSGSSAGGHAIIMHCDRLAAAFPRASSKCLADSGFFVDAKDRFGVYSWREYIRQVTALHRIEVPKCPAGAQVRGNWVCFFPEHTLARVTTPLFLFHSFFDWRFIHGAQ